MHVTSEDLEDETMFGCQAQITEDDPKGFMVDLCTMLCKLGASIIFESEHLQREYY